MTKQSIALQVAVYHLNFKFNLFVFKFSQRYSNKRYRLQRQQKVAANLPQFGQTTGHSKIVAHMIGVAKQ